MVHLAVFVLAAFISTLGVGGGVFYVPIFLGFGLSFHQATTASLLIIAITGLSAASVYHREGLVDWRLALLLDPVKDVGAFIGGLYAGLFGERLLSLLFAAVLVGGSVLMIRQKNDEALGAEASSSGWSRRVGGEAYSVNFIVVIPCCLAAGLLSGLLGIGGGIFMIPLMVLAMRVPMRVAVATSAFMVCLTGTFGFIGGAMAGRFTPSTGLLLAFSGFLGAQVGPRVMVRLDKNRLRQVFIVFLYIVAALMVYSGIA